MKRAYMFHVDVDFDDEQPFNAASPGGMALRAAAESVERAIESAVQSAAPPNVSRTGVRVNVVRCECQEED